MRGVRTADPSAVRAAAWVARCVGRGDAAPLRPDDLTALAAYLEIRNLESGEVLFRGGEPTNGVWIIRGGRAELAVGSGRRRAVVGVLVAGDADGDIPLLLGMDVPYTARAIDRLAALFLPATPSSHIAIIANIAIIMPQTMPATAPRLTVAASMSSSSIEIFAYLSGST